MIRRGTRLIDWYVTNRDPVMAQRLAEAIGREVYPQFDRAPRFPSVRMRCAICWKKERLKANLQKSEAAVAE